MRTATDYLGVTIQIAGDGAHLPARPILNVTPRRWCHVVAMTFAVPSKARNYAQ
jgi:hypothetical protein